MIFMSVIACSFLGKTWFVPCGCVIVRVKIYCNGISMCNTQLLCLTKVPFHAYCLNPNRAFSIHVIGHLHALQTQCMHTWMGIRYRPWTAWAIYMAYTIGKYTSAS